MSPAIPTADRGPLLRRWLAAALWVSCLSCTACVENRRQVDAPPTPDHTPFLVAGEVEQIALGHEDLCLRLRGGRVLCRRDWREVPVGPPRSFQPVAGIADAVEVAVGRGHACARTASGAVACWGRNPDGQAVPGGQDVEHAPRFVLQAGAAEVRADDTRSCARLTDGAVRCWGTVSGAKHVVPVIMPGFAKTAGLSLGSGLVCARQTDGAVRCARDGAGAMVAGLDQVTDLVVSSEAVCALRSDGILHCFPPTPMTAAEKPVKIANVPAPASAALGPATPMRGVTEGVQLAAGRAHVCVRTAKGAIYCFGRNDYGQLGDGTREARSEPTKVARIEDAVAIAAGGDRTCARRLDGTIECWGRDLLDDPMFHALTGLQAPPDVPGERDSLVPEVLRVPASVTAD